MSSFRCVSQIDAGMGKKGMNCRKHLVSVNSRAGMSRILVALSALPILIRSCLDNRFAKIMLGLCMSTFLAIYSHLRPDMNLKTLTCWSSNILSR